ncbi:MAG: aspartate-semialdehyde dehydrogenase [Candidatus Diapherotrites archaeon CG11_big_fil_rev_8_21_14_0_20_37_9]|nr:MAG: aspartate-semialdehyde dehydrogenase [Candidatus Diapherotrites archaeon CG11_big_fil_rev_8_21_14_0_20_37_9]
MKKFNIGILGATGMVGQNYISLLENHPWFNVTWLSASERSAGKKYCEAVSGRWHMQKEIPSQVKNLRIKKISDIADCKANCDFVFSALDSGVAKEFEEKYAKAGIPVVSNASTHRHTKDVPMIIPEINSRHLEIIPGQMKSHGWDKGFIVVKPNCSLQSYMTPLFALHEKFGVEKAIISTLQAVSGAGHPGVSSFDIIDNVVPYIGGEEEKSEKEPLKILGKIDGNEIKYFDGLEISAHCNRVPVIDGHLACVSVKFRKKPSKEEILDLWEKFRGIPQELDLPFAPKQPIIYRDEADRPQPRLDRDSDKGMAVTVGRLRECNVFDYRFVGLSHNTVRGAAGGGILNAELLVKQGYINR